MIQLERFKEIDISTLANWIESERELRQWAAHTLSYPLVIDELAKIIKIPDTICFKAVRHDQMVGYADFSRINQQNRTATICRVLVPKDKRGQGIAFEMLRKMCSYAFKELKLRRIDLLVFASNESAIKVYQRLGFQREGHLREWFQLDQNENWDAIQMGLLEREFLAD